MWVLDTAAGRYDVFVTVDRNILYQQRLDNRPFAIVVLRAKANTLRELAPLVPRLLAILRELKSGEVREVGGE